MRNTYSGRIFGDHKIINRIHRRALEDGGKDNGDAHGGDESDGA